MRADRFDYSEDMKRWMRELEESPEHRALNAAWRAIHYRVYQTAEEQLAKFVGQGVDVALFWRVTGEGARFEIITQALPRGTKELPPALHPYRYWAGGIYPISQVEGPALPPQQ